MLNVSIFQTVDTTTTATAPKVRNVRKRGNVECEPAKEVHQSKSPELVTLNTSTEFQVDMNSNRADVGKVVGTILNEVFATMDLYRSCGSRYLSATAPVQIRFNLGRTSIDTGTIDRKLQARLKVGYTAKARKRFAHVLWQIVQWTLREVQPVDIDTLNAQLEKQIHEALTA
jgi:hypothetical protein